MIDQGIVVVLESGSIAVSLANDFSVEISIVRAADVATLVLPDTAYFWESTADEEFRIERSFIDILE